MVAAALNSLIKFDPSQERLFRDESRVIAVCWHRQKGKDFVAACKAVDHVLRTGETWLIISKGQRQADESFAKCVAVSTAFKIILGIVGRDAYKDEQFTEYDQMLQRDFVWTKREITFPNGGRILSIPGKDPKTCVGYSANMTWTEYGLFDNGGYDHWADLFPIITRSNYRLLMISTPRGKNHRFYQVINDPKTYSVHFCDIYKSVAEDGYILRDTKGVPCSVDEFKRIYNDDAKFRREYGCEFCGDLEALIRYARILAASEAGRDNPFDCLRISGDNQSAFTRNFFNAPEFSSGAGRYEIGWDVARTSDLSSVWCNYAIPGVSKKLRKLAIMRDTSFALQREVVRAAMNAAPGNVGAGDATGMGMSDNETLAAEFGVQRWLPFNFGGKGKPELGSLLVSHFDNANQAIPAMNGEFGYVAADLIALQADRSGGTLRIDEGSNPLLPDSHCDLAYSCSLALKAASLTPVEAGWKSF